MLLDLLISSERSSLHSSYNHDALAHQSHKITTMVSNITINETESNWQGSFGSLGSSVPLNAVGAYLSPKTSLFILNLGLTCQSLLFECGWWNLTALTIGDLPTADLPRFRSRGDCRSVSVKNSVWLICDQDFLADAPEDINIESGPSKYWRPPITH